MSLGAVKRVREFGPSSIRFLIFEQILSTNEINSFLLCCRKELEQKREKSDCELLETQRSLEQEKSARLVLSHALVTVSNFLEVS